MPTETDVDLAGGRTLHVYDTALDGVPVFWHHGTPNTGEPPVPLFDAAKRLGLRWVSYDRPNYGPSTPLPGRDLASAAADTDMVADALGLERFAVMGHSGGSNHALACAALLRDRVPVCVCVSGLAPYGAEGLDWFAGMADGGIADLKAAAAGRTVLEQHLAHGEFDPEQFTPADEEALSGDWAWLGGVAGKALQGGIDGMVDDQLAYVAPWGYVPEQVVAPVLLVHGEQDRMVPSSHSRWLAERVPSAELWLRPDDGHISVLSSAEDALAWLAARVNP
jgi:pimeloyl-ACP methyl ester carboxylesterase